MFKRIVHNLFHIDIAGLLQPSLLLALMTVPFLFFCGRTTGPIKDHPAKKWKYSSFEQIRNEFKDPPMWFAPHTFWFWDAPLNPELTASMASEMSRQRLNPGYAHARHSGNPNGPFPELPRKQWLSPLWFESFGTALKAAEKNGMTLGYCDEYWWPSGQAAGRILEQHPELEARSLQWSRQVFDGPSSVSLPDAFFHVAVGITNSGLLLSETLRIVPGGSEKQVWQVPPGRWTIFSYTLYHHAGADGGLVNYLDSTLMDVFIPMAHQSYEKHFRTRMGDSLPGVFVDNEGDYGWKLAWSEDLAKKYQEMKGRDIRLWLPLLTEQDEEGVWVKARYDWFDSVSEVYCSQFLGRLSDWLQQRGMHCISNLWEESLMLQTRAVGDFMRAQRSVSMPGNDCLQMKSQQVHDFKETQSVCEFEDRPFMSEIMGVAGWEQTPVQMKMAVNAITAWGVSHVVPHGINLNRELHTIPYPADWFTENPYWRYLHLWTDFSRRSSFVVRQGRLDADILLINPLESVWALSDGYFNSDGGDRWGERVNQINHVYSKTMDVLTQARLDYLIADSHYMKAAGIIASSGIAGQTGDAGNAGRSSRPEHLTRLMIEEHPFAIVVLPPMFILSRNTAGKILDFAEAGGRVIFLGTLPAGSPEKGARDPEIIDQMSRLRMLPGVVDLSGPASKESGNFDELIPVIEKMIQPQCQIVEGEFPMLYSHRKIDDADFYWLVNNTSIEQSCTLLLREGEGRSEIWNCESGEILTVGHRKTDGGTLINLRFKPFEAFWLVFDAGKPEHLDSLPFKVVKQQTLNGPWTLSFPETERIQASSARALFLKARADIGPYLNPDYDDSQWPWQSVIGPVQLNDEWRASLLYNPDPYSQQYFRYAFTIEREPIAGIINVNADNQIRFWLNGKPVKPGSHANTWAGVDFHDIGPLLQKGKNVLAVHARNYPGHGWAVVQGSVQLDDGSSIAFHTGPDWKSTSKVFDGWRSGDFDDSGWDQADLASEDMALDEIPKMSPPLQTFQSGQKMIFRIPIPPGAEKVTLPGWNQKTVGWIDGDPLSNAEMITLPPDSRMLIFEHPGNDIFIKQPLTFTYRRESVGSLSYWEDMGLRRFTGFVDYETTFQVSKDSGRLRLDLGEVYHMAEVWVNDRHAGERLWPPFEFDLTDLVNTGDNRLRIRIGNLMANHMGLMDDMGKLRHWGWNGTPPDSCFDAGLIGPVKIVTFLRT